MANDQKRFLNNTLNVAFRVLIIATVPAIIAAISGKAIDSKFGIAPFGSLVVLLIAFVCSWAAILIYYKKIIASVSEKQKTEQQENEQ